MTGEKSLTSTRSGRKPPRDSRSEEESRESSPPLLNEGPELVRDSHT